MPAAPARHPGQSRPASAWRAATSATARTASSSSTPRGTGWGGPDAPQRLAPGNGCSGVAQGGGGGGLVLASLAFGCAAGGWQGCADIQLALLPGRAARVLLRLLNSCWGLLCAQKIRCCCRIRPLKCSVLLPRNFRCDCGNSKFKNLQCKLLPVSRGLGFLQAKLK